MCSIFGVLGVQPDRRILSKISERAKDRGRDGGRIETYFLENGLIAALGNWRATPTTEVAVTDLQPYNGIVHNGTIANDRELGNPPNTVDSKILAKVIRRDSLAYVHDSLVRIKGSYALAIVSNDTVYLACNYKPIYYYKIGDSTYFSSMERHFQDVVIFGTSPCKVYPYSIINLLNGHTLQLPRLHCKRALVIASAGLDSTCVAHYLQKKMNLSVTLLHFNYGCRATSKEMECILKIAKALECNYEILPLDYKYLKGESPLFDKKAISGPVAGAEFAHEWVPARNLLMLSYATAYAEANDYGYIALGNNLEESGAYPDNEEEMSHLFNGILPYSVRDGVKVELVWPVGNLMKHEIVKLGVELDTPFEHTWSCYNAGDKHCGVCGPCYMRRVAFHRNGLVDPVPYEVSYEETITQQVVST